MWPSNQTGISEVDRVVGSSAGGDKILRINDPGLPCLYIGCRHGIHVMNKKAEGDLMASYSQIATTISKNNFSASETPFS